MRRIISLLLAAVMAVGMSATVFATNPKITKQSTALADVYVGDVSPGTKIFLPLAKDAFEGATEDLTASDVRTSKITVKYTAKSGPKAIESVEIKEQNNPKVAGVLITLVDPFTSTKPLDFELSVYLYIDGKRQSVGTSVSGTLTNDEQGVYSDTDYVDLSDGSVAVCEENASKVEAYLGNDVSMFVRMVKGKSYAGIASTDPTDADIEMLNQYSDIVNVYNLTLNGLTGSGNIVKIDSEQNLYVYDGDLNYLGTTANMLPLNEKYFTAEKKLDVIENSYEDEDEYLDEESGSDSEPEPDTDTNASSAASADYLGAASPSGSNPDTGVSPIFGIAVVAGMLSLAAMGAISFKKRK